MKINKLLEVCAIVLLLISLINVSWEFVSNRWLRIFTSFLFFLFSLKTFTFKRLIVPSIFALFVCCDIFLLNLESHMYKTGYYTLHSLICLFLILLTFRHLNFKAVRTNVFEIASLVIFFGINSWILVTLGNLFSTMVEDPLVKFLFYINGFLIVCLVIAVFFYSIHSPNRRSSFYFLSVLGLTISDLILFAIYFLEVRDFRSVDNAFYILGLYFLLIAFMEYRKINEEEKLSLKEEVSEEAKPKYSGYF